MTSCPDDRELLELVDGELTPEQAIDVIEHLTECAPCRMAIGRSEAALDYALGGLSDTGRWSLGPAAELLPVAPLKRRHPGRRRWLAGGGLAAAAALFFALYLLPGPSQGVATDAGSVADAADTHMDTHVTATGPQAELQLLLARAERLRDTAGSESQNDGRELLATGALAAAQVRAWTVGPDAARVRVQDVIERFPGTSAAREARALLAASTWTEAR